MLTFYFSGADGSMIVSDTLTAGMVGRQVLLKFSPEWENLSKTVIFSDGEETRDVVFTGNPVTIPAEVLKYPLRRLAVGALGLGEGGKVVIPTIRALGPEIRPGVEPSGDPGTDPELPVWQQILTLLGDLEDLLTNNRDTLVEAINEALSKASDAKRMYFIPHVSAEGILSWSNYGNLPNPHPANIRGPAGADGKSAYRYAQEGGYEGTEGEFVEKMAAIALGQLMLKDAVTGKDYKLYVENGNLRMREGEV